MVVRWLNQAKINENYSLEGEIKARWVKVIEFKGYNSKIVSAGKDWREEVLQLDQFYLGFVLKSNLALIPLCNTRFIKEHKPSNHICARIKSHVYTTEWTVYHSTYHVKDIIKQVRMLFITIMTKCLIQSMRKRKTYKITLVGSWAGRHRDVDWETNA